MLVPLQTNSKAPIQTRLLMMKRKALTEGLTRSISLAEGEGTRKIRKKLRLTLRETPWKTKGVAKSRKEISSLPKRIKK